MRTRRPSTQRHVCWSNSVRACVCVCVFFFEQRMKGDLAGRVTNDVCSTWRATCRPSLLIVLILIGYLPSRHHHIDPVPRPNERNQYVTRGRVGARPNTPALSLGVNNKHQRVVGEYGGGCPGGGVGVQRVQSDWMWHRSKKLKSGWKKGLSCLVAGALNNELKAIDELLTAGKTVPWRK